MRKAVARLCVLGLVWGLGLPVRPALAVPDIADFSLGITRGETLLRAAAPCGDNLCGEVAFGGKTWGGTFRFRDDALVVISLFGPPDDAYLEAAFQGFAESPYMVYRAVSDDAVFDFPSRAAEGQSPEHVDAAFLEFLRGLRSSGCSFASYFYTEPAVYEFLKLEARRSADPALTRAEKADKSGKAGRTNGGRDAEAPPAEEASAGSPAMAAASVSASDLPAPAVPTAPGPRDGAEAAAQPTAARPARPSPDGVVCNLTIDGEGIVIIIMARADLQAEMAARAAREAADAARIGDGNGPERFASVQKP